MGLTPSDWNEHLQGLDKALVRILLGWLPHLRPLLTRTVLDTPNARTGVVDGFDGITTRGTPERLLSTEWALADAAPDLFLLRAAAGEQLHHQLSRREDANHQDVLLIVDTSPSQAGAPQLIPLAMALVLLRAGHCSVWWTDTRAPGENHPVTLDDPDSLLAMLTSGTAERVDPLIWQTCVASAEAMTTVCIGQPPAGMGDAQVHIRELLAEPTLEVRSGSERVHLPLPSPQDAVRALRAERAFSPSPEQGGPLQITLGTADDAMVFLWNESYVRRITASKRDTVLTYASPGWQIVGVAADGNAARVLQTNGESFDDGAPNLSTVAGKRRWSRQPGDGPVHGLWRTSNRLIVHCGGYLYRLSSGGGGAQRLCTAKAGGVLCSPRMDSKFSQQHGCWMTELVAISDEGDDPAFRFVDPFTVTRPIRPTPADRPIAFAHTWNGGVRAVTATGHYELHSPQDPSRSNSPPPAGLLVFWKLHGAGIVPVVFKPKVGKLYVGKQLIGAPKLIKAVAHHKLPIVVGITEANALVRITFQPPASPSSKVRTQLDVLVSRL